MTSAGVFHFTLLAILCQAESGPWASIRDEIGHAPGQGVLIEEQLADFCQFVLEVSLDQVQSMERLLSLKEIDARMNWYIEKRANEADRPLPPSSQRILHALFVEGEIPRGRVPEILGVHERTSNRIVAPLLAEGLVISVSTRASLKIGFPEHVLQYYFPALYEPSIMGPEYTQMYIPCLSGCHPQQTTTDRMLPCP